MRVLRKCKVEVRRDNLLQIYTLWCKYNIREMGVDVVTIGRTEVKRVIVSIGGP